MLGPKVLGPGIPLPPRHGGQGVRIGGAAAPSPPLPPQEFNCNPSNANASACQCESTWLKQPPYMCPAGELDNAREKMVAQVGGWWAAAALCGCQSPVHALRRRRGALHAEGSCGPSCECAAPVRPASRVGLPPPPLGAGAPAGLPGLPAVQLSRVRVEQDHGPGGRQPGRVPPSRAGRVRVSCAAQRAQCIAASGPASRPLPRMNCQKVPITGSGR